MIMTSLVCFGLVLTISLTYQDHARGEGHTQSQSTSIHCLDNGDCQSTTCDSKEHCKTSSSNSTALSNSTIPSILRFLPANQLTH